VDGESADRLAGELRDSARLDSPAIAAGPIAVTRLMLKAFGAATRTRQIAAALTRVTDITTQHATDRVQLGRPLGGVNHRGLNQISSGTE
jgi:acyl-CoA dehydrogenase